MSSGVIQVQAAELAWLPSSSDGDLEVLHEFDGPLITKFVQSGARPVVAMCLGGEGLKLGLWGYVALSEEEWSRLDGDDDLPFDEPEDLHNWVMALLLSERYRAVSLAIDGRVVFHSDIAPRQDFMDVTKQLVEAFDPEAAVRIMTMRGRLRPSLSGAPLEPQLQRESEQLLAGV